MHSTTGYKKVDLCAIAAAAAAAGAIVRRGSGSQVEGFVWGVAGGGEVGYFRASSAETRAWPGAGGLFNNPFCLLNVAAEECWRLFRQYFFPDIYRQPKKKMPKKNMKNKSKKYISCLRQARLGQQLSAAWLLQLLFLFLLLLPVWQVVARRRRLHFQLRLRPVVVLSHLTFWHATAATAVVAHRSRLPCCHVATLHVAMLPHWLR